MSFRTALITGGSSGIGLALGKRMAAEGVEVVLAARRGEVLRREAEAIEASGGKAHALELDLSDAVAAQEAIRAVDDELGGIDLLVANAGLAVVRWSGKLDWEAHCRAMLEVNVVGFTATVTSLLPRMVERRRGHIVGVSSLSSYRGLPRMAIYCGSKAYVTTFLESLRVDLRTTGVGVTEVRPGFIRTPLNDINTIKMPMLMGLEPAVDIIWDGIRRERALVEFPWVLARGLRASRLLPGAVYDAAVAKIL